MSDTTTTTPVEPKSPRFVKLTAKVRRLKRSPYTLIAAAAAASGTAAYLGTNKALRNNIAETASDAVESVADMLDPNTSGE